MNFEDFLSYYNISIHYKSIPNCTKGFAYYNGRGYLVMINLNYSSLQQKETLVHEMIHIFEDHFICSQDQEEACEEHVHQIIKGLHNYTFHFA